MVTNISSFEQEPSFEAITMVASQDTAAQQEVRPATGIESTLIVATLGAAAVAASLFKRNKQS